MIVADTGPLLAAADRRDPAHLLASTLVLAAGRELLVPDPVAVETDWLVRRRIGDAAARAFLQALTDGVPRRVTLSQAVFARAAAIDRQYADLGLGLVDASVMALAEAERIPILTFDFEHFRAAPQPGGEPWELLVDEARYLRAIRG